MNRLKPFRFGVISEQMTGRADWLTQVKQIEAFGYDTLLIRDHFVPDFFGDQFAPLIALAVAATVTDRLRIGTMVLDNDYRHPVMLAKEAATLDLLSGGRFELGLGAGWLRKEYRQAGLSFDQAGLRIERLGESIQVIKGFFAGKPVHFEGQHYQVNGIEGYPTPSQCPPPLLLGGGKPRMLRLAGREADIISLLTASVASGTLQIDPAERLGPALEQKLGWIREGAGSRFDTIELSLMPTIIFAEDRDLAARQYLAQQGWSELSVRDVRNMPSVFIGTASDIARDMVARRQRYGISYYVFDDAMMAACAPLVALLAGQ